MKYIKENIRIKDGQEIYDDELDILLPFINQLAIRDDVEGICLIPTYKQEEVGYEPRNYCSIYVNLFINKNTEEEKIENNIYKIINNLSNRRIPINEYNFEIIDLNKINQDNIIYSVLFEKNLISSYIIYDKNGELTKLQEKLKEQIKPWKSLVQIENIDKLDIESQKPAVKELVRKKEK